VWADFLLALLLASKCPENYLKNLSLPSEFCYVSAEARPGGGGGRVMARKKVSLLA
jgi:hypothetical protein